MKFTSEDLLKAMGLKVGDRIFVDVYREGIIIFDDVYGVCVSFDGIVNILNWLIGKKYTIIQPKPTLTEGEKVILRNVKEDYQKISRSAQKGVIILHSKEREYHLGLFSHLFQFIKWEDEPYSIEELLKE